MIQLSLFQWSDDLDPNQLLLIFGLFFAVLALVTLIYWIFFMDHGGARGRNFGSSGRNNRDRNFQNGRPQRHARQSEVSLRRQSEQSRDATTTDRTQIRNSLATSLSPRSDEYDYQNMPRMSTVSQSEAEAAFKDDIFNSFARWDDEFGVIYIVPPGPDDIDDLKAIRGIDQAYENELHRIGIFMFKQFTIWPNETCRNISQELGSGDRLFKENWPDQARQLHLQKYREQL